MVFAGTLHRRRLVELAHDLGNAMMSCLLLSACALAPGGAADGRHGKSLFSGIRGGLSGGQPGCPHRLPREPVHLMAARS